MIFGGGAFLRRLHHEDGVLMIGLMPLKEEEGAGELILPGVQEEKPCEYTDGRWLSTSRGAGSH